MKFRGWLKEIEKIEIKKSEFWAHNLIIKVFEKEIKLVIQEREKVEEYEEVVNKWQSIK